MLVMEPTLQSDDKEYFHVGYGAYGAYLAIWQQGVFSCWLWSLPCNLTTMGIFIWSSAAAATIPWAMMSHRIMPPKMFTRIAFTCTTVHKKTAWIRRRHHVLNVGTVPRPWKHSTAFSMTVAIWNTRTHHFTRVEKSQCYQQRVARDCFLSRSVHLCKNPWKYPAWCKLPGFLCRNGK